MNSNRLVSCEFSPSIFFLSLFYILSPPVQVQEEVELEEERVVMTDMQGRTAIKLAEQVVYDRQQVLM